MSPEEFATKSHAGQFRRTGTPYIHHPIRVANTVASLYSSTQDMVSAAFLHDVIEDCNVEYATILCMYGTKVASLVKELTFYIPPFSNRKVKSQYKIDQISNMSTEALIIKLADRFDNISECIATNDYHFVRRYYNETLEILQLIKKLDNYSLANDKQTIDINYLIAIIETKMIDILNWLNANRK